MALEIEGLSSAFQQKNARLVEATEAFLSRVVADRARHALFLNTLAMMEHLGSHKIMATQQGRAIDQPTLKHLAEEARHAFFFKRLAEREARRTLSFDRADLLGPAAGRSYFQRLEAEIVKSLPADAPPQTAYLTMSILIEFRAVWGYNLYQSALRRAGHAISLNSLLAEESGHLTGMFDRLTAMGQIGRLRLPGLWILEQVLYARLLAALDRGTSAAAA